MRTLFTAVRALIYLAGFALVWGWAALQMRRLDKLFGMVIPRWASGFGVVLMIAGAALGLFCLGIFTSRGRGTPAPFDPPAQFVAQGPYRYIRNPMYVGGVTVLAGLGFYLMSFSILLFSLLACLLAHLFVVYYEEPHLKAKFGPAYEDYLRSVPGWIPSGRI